MADNSLYFAVEGTHLPLVTEPSYFSMTYFILSIFHEDTTFSDPLETKAWKWSFIVTLEGLRLSSFSSGKDTSSGPDSLAPLDTPTFIPFTDGLTVVTLGTFLFNRFLSI